MHTMLTLKRFFIYRPRWRRMINKEIDSLDSRTSKEVYEKMSETIKMIQIAQRTDNKQDILRLKGRLEILNWFAKKYKDYE